MADGGPPPGDFVDHLRRLGRALDGAGGWAALPPPALARARALFADAAAWREFYTHPDSEEEGDSSGDSGDEAPLLPAQHPGGGTQPPAAAVAAAGQPASDARSILSPLTTSPAGAAAAAAAAAAAVVGQAATGAAAVTAATKPFPLRAVLQRELTLRSIQAAPAGGAPWPTGPAAAAAAPWGAVLPASGGAGGSGGGGLIGDRPPAGPARVAPVSDVFQSVEPAPLTRPSPYVDDEIDVSVVVAPRAEPPGGTGGGAPQPLPPPPPVYILMDGSSERFFGHGGDSLSGSSDASDRGDGDGSDFSSSTDGDGPAASAAAAAAAAPSGGGAAAPPRPSWDDADRVAALACRLCASRPRLLPAEPLPGSAPLRGALANGAGPAAKRRRRVGRRRPGGSDREGSSIKRPRTTAAASGPDVPPPPGGGGSGSAAPAAAAAASDDRSGDGVTTPVKLLTSLCGADTDEGGGGEDDSQLGSADREKQRMNDAKDALAHLVGSDSGEDEPGPVAKVLPVLSTRRALVARPSWPVESSSEEEPPPAKAAATGPPAAPPPASPARPAAPEEEPDDSGSTSSDESVGDRHAAAHAAAVEREAAAWTAGLVAEVGHHAGRAEAAAPAVPLANGGHALPQGPAPASSSTAAAATVPLAATTAPPLSSAGRPLNASLSPPSPYVPHGERRVLVAYLRQALAAASEQARGAVVTAGAVAPAPADPPQGVAAQSSPPAKGSGCEKALGGSDAVEVGATDASHAVAAAAAGVLGALTGLVQSARHGRLASATDVVARMTALLGRAPAVFAPPLAAGPAVASALAASLRDVRRQRRQRRRSAVAAAHSVAVTSVEQAAADVAFRRRVTVDVHRGALLSARPRWRALRRRTEAGTRAALASGGGCGADWSREPPACGLTGEPPPPADNAFVFPEYGDLWNAVAPLPSLAAVREAQAGERGAGGGGGDVDDEEWAPNGGLRTPGAVRRNVDAIARMRRQRRRLSAYARSAEPTADAFDLVAAGDDDSEDGGSPFWLPSRGDDGPSSDGTPGHREHASLRSTVALLLYHGGFEDASSAALDALTDATAALFERVATSLSSARSAPASLPPPPVPQSPPPRLPSTMMVHPLQNPLATPRAVRGAHVPARLRYTPPPPHPHTALSDVVSVTRRVLAASGNRGGLPEISTFRSANAPRVENALRESAMRLGIVSVRVSESRIRSSRPALAAAAAAAAGCTGGGSSIKADAFPPAGANSQLSGGGSTFHPNGAAASAGGAATGFAANSTPQGVAAGATAAPVSPPDGGAAVQGDLDSGAPGTDGFPPAALLFGLFGPAAVVDVLCLSRLGLGAASVPPHMAAWALAPFALQIPPPPPPPVPAVKAEPEHPLVGIDPVADGGLADASATGVGPAAGADGGMDVDVAADLDGMDGVDFAGVVNGLTLSIVHGGGGSPSGGGPAGVMDMVDMDDDDDGAAAAALDELDVPLTALANVVRPATALGASMAAASAAGGAGLPPTPTRPAADGGDANAAGAGGGHAGAEPSAVDYGLSWADGGGGDQDAERSVDQITALF